MNLLFAFVAVEPPGVVTTTSTSPAARAGLIAVTVVEFTTEKLAAAVPPNDTPVAPVRSVPVIVTDVLPVVAPEVGEIPVSVGVGTTKVNFELAPTDVVPPGVVTTTSTTPADPTGLVAVIKLSLLTVKLAASTPPNDTAVAPVRFDPVIVTIVPPNVEPDVGDRLVRAGRGVTNVNLLLAVTADCPPAVVTRTST